MMHSEHNSELKDIEELSRHYCPADSIPPLSSSNLSRVQPGHEMPGPRNSAGYRGDEFEDRGVFNVAYLGCSWVEGDGLRRGDIFPDHVSETLSTYIGSPVPSWNLGRSGSSIDHMSRLLPSVVNVLRPDFVVIVLTELERREFFTDDGRCLPFVPMMTNLQAYREAGIPIPDSDRTSIDAMVTLSNPLSNVARLLRSFRLWEALLDASHIPYLFSNIDHPPLNDAVKELLRIGALPHKHYLGHKFEKVDEVDPTNSHPGKESHVRFARSVAQKIIDHGMIGRSIPEGATCSAKSARTTIQKIARAVKSTWSQPRTNEREPARPNGQIYPLW